MEKRFSIIETLKAAFIGVIDNFRLFTLSLVKIGLIGILYTILFIALIVLVIFLVVAMLRIPLSLEAFTDKATMLNFLKPAVITSLMLFILPLIFLFSVLGQSLWFGFIHIVLKVYDKKDTTCKLMFTHLGRALKGVLAGLLYALIVSVGLVLLVLPGIYWMIRFSFFPFVIVDTNAGILESLRQSYRITKGSFWQLFLLMIILHIISFIPSGSMQYGGILGALVGALLIVVVVPFFVLTNVMVYRKLSSPTPSR